jgi:uncharacterized RDD family membrane protein YckC
MEDILDWQERERNFIYSGFWRRVAAALIDAICISFIQSGLIYLTGISLQQGLIFYGQQWLYFALMESSGKKATIGKMVLGIEVVNEEGGKISFKQATGRFLGKILSVVLFFIGFIMVAFTEKKQGLHDKLANTYVIKSKMDF